MSTHTLDLRRRSTRPAVTKFLRLMAKVIPNEDYQVLVAALNTPITHQHEDANEIRRKRNRAHRIAERLMTVEAVMLTQPEVGEWLSRRELHAARLKWLHGLSMRKIAVEMKISRWAARQLLERSSYRLRYESSKRRTEMPF